MKISIIPVPVSKCRWVTTTLMSPSASAMPSTSSHTIHSHCCCMLELAILADAYPEHVSNMPGRGKDYLCQMCCFSHSNLDSILTHVRRHLDIMVGYPVCIRGYKNVTSLQKHDRDAHNIKIVATTSPLQGLIDPKEEIEIPHFVIICPSLSLLQYSFSNSFCTVTFVVPNYQVSVSWSIMHQQQRFHKLQHLSNN